MDSRLLKYADIMPNGVDKSDYKEALPFARDIRGGRKEVCCFFFQL